MGYSRFPLCRRWTILSLANFVVVSLLGVLLRYKIAFPLPVINYKYLLNAHSHFAFSGWVSMAIFTALVYMVSDQEGEIKAVYRYQFLFGQLANFGMLFSFPFEGYGTVAIIFSSLSILFSYWFAWQYRKDLYRSSLPLPVKYFAAAALLFLVISSAGPFLLGYILSHRIYDNELYHNAIYLFLHFQYNGWFSFGVLAIFFYVLNKKQVKIDERKVTRAFWLLFVACVPAYMLSLLWMNPPVWVFWLGGVAGLIQLIALAVLAGIFRTILKIPDFFQNQYARILWILSGISFGLKLVLQAFSAVPFLGQFAFGTRAIIIGYLHLVMLGFISFFLIGFFLEEKLFKPVSGISRPALFIFLVGVIANEVFLLIQGTSFLSGNGWASGGLFLLLAALLMFAGLLLLLYFQVRRQTGSAVPAG